MINGYIFVVCFFFFLSWMDVVVLLDKSNMVIVFFIGVIE